MYAVYYSFFSVIFSSMALNKIFKIQFFLFSAFISYKKI